MHLCWNEDHESKSTSPVTLWFEASEETPQVAAKVAPPRLKDCSDTDLHSSPARRKIILTSLLCGQYDEGISNGEKEKEVNFQRD